MTIRVTKAPKMDQEKVYSAFMKANSLVAGDEFRFSFSVWREERRVRAAEAGAPKF